MGYPLEILSVGIAVELKVRLENRQLFLGEGRPDPLRLAALATVLRVAVLRRRGVVPLDDVEIVSLAEQPRVEKSELLPGRELPRAGVAGETCEVINTLPRPSHPVTGAHASPALCTFRPEGSANMANKKEDVK